MSLNFFPPESEANCFFVSIRNTEGRPISESTQRFDSWVNLRAGGLEALSVATPAALFDEFRTTLESKAIGTDRGVVRDEPGCELDYLRALASRFAPNVGFAAHSWTESEDCRR